MGEGQNGGCVWRKYPTYFRNRIGQLVDVKGDQLEM